MITAIIYTTNAGTTEKYAKMIGEKIGLPVYPLSSAPIQKGSEILYLGWVMASSVKGYKKARRKYNVKAVCGVCMASTGSQLPEVRKQNGVPQDTPVFTLQGGFDINKLHGIYKFMMNIVKKASVKGLSEKPDRTPEEDDMLEMMLHGGDRVSEENLKELLDWYYNQK